MGKWTDMFTDANGDGSSFKTDVDKNDGSIKVERITVESDSSGHYHDIVKGSTDGGIKEIRTGKRG